MIILRKKILQLIAVIFLLFLFAFAWQRADSGNDLNRGLLALFPFEGNIKDYSGNENRSFLVGTERYIQGEFGKALELDGRSFIKVRMATLPISNQNRTLTLWVKSYDTDESKFPNFAVCYGIPLDGQSFGIMEDGFPDIDKNNWFTFTFGRSDSRYNVDFQSSVKGDWQFLCTVYQDGKVINFVDGVLSSTQALEINTSGTNQFYIGTFPMHVYSFVGALDEVRLYDRALSEQEIEDLFKQPPAPPVKDKPKLEEIVPQIVEGKPYVLLGNLIKGTGSDPIQDAALVIEGDRIAAVGTRAEIEIPREAVVIDLHDSTILPGLIDAHVHNGYNDLNLKVWAQEGITTVRDLGVSYELDAFVIRDKLQSDPKCARLVAVGPILTVPEGFPPGNIGLRITSVEDAREKTTILLDKGADVIKVGLESRAGPILSPDELSVIVETAHQRSKLVSAHVTTSQDLRLAFESGVDDMAHIVWFGHVPDDIIKRMVESGVYWVTTLAATPDKIRAGCMESLSRFVKAGGMVVYGTDAGYIPHQEIGMSIRELKLMKEAGMTPLDVITAATRNAAQVSSIAEDVGTLERGKIADILVVEGNPLEDLNELSKVRLVIREGVIIRK
ncbi:MAG: amidohydrolase family protein [Candidatus Aminicenantaceae bacterium]